MNTQGNNVQIDVLEGFKDFKPTEVENKNYVSGFFKNIFSSSGDPSQIDYTRVFIFIIILAFLGLNIFSYLGDIIAWFKKVFGPLFKDIFGSLGYAVTESSKQTLNVAAEGTKAGVDIAAGTLKSTINVLEGQLDHDQLQKNQNSENEISKKKLQNMLNSTNTKSVNQKQDEVGKLREKKSTSSDLATATYSMPEMDDSLSKMQTKGSGKSGYCYIGEDRGFRSCIKVGPEDACMSGDIFPSRDICINPNLRE
tara:strand:+ start:1489 stop:2247 length:759 start_codon:yes stop_codon:yes gene_type:complete